MLSRRRPRWGQSIIPAYSATPIVLDLCFAMRFDGTVDGTTLALLDSARRHFAGHTAAVLQTLSARLEGRIYNIIAAVELLPGVTALQLLFLLNLIDVNSTIKATKAKDLGKDLSIEAR